jgi:chitinase
VGGRLGSIGEGGGDPGTDPEPEPTDCGEVGAWSAGAVYVGGDEAAHGGALWRAAWWTQGETPGSADVWRRIGDC